LAVRRTHGLVDHDARVGQGEALALVAAAEEEARHGGGEADVDGDDLGPDVVHRVVNRQPGDDRAAGAVDVEVDGLRRVLRVEVEHDADDLVGEFVVDLRTEEDDALAVESVVDVDPVGGLRAGHAVRDLGHAEGHHDDTLALELRRGASPRGGALHDARRRQRARLQRAQRRRERRRLEHGSELVSTRS